ncbi:MAG: coproporphyrinogen III oxidase family protein, partial [Clostridia bacterium]|nr:coproporphyrinogen III oxidase family protein [Clostridia bacterium]
DYLGFGPAAHSLWRGVRTGHSRDLAAYLVGRDITEPEETLTERAAMDESVMLRLRLADGMENATFTAHFGTDFDTLYGDRAAPFVAAGLLTNSAERMSFTPRGFDLSNTVLAALIGE